MRRVADVDYVYVESAACRLQDIYGGPLLVWRMAADCACICAEMQMCGCARAMRHAYDMRLESEENGYGT